MPAVLPDPRALAGQAGIALREALAAGDAAGVLAGIPALDEAHRVELLLGAALRDARGDHRAAHLFVAAEQEGGGARWGELARALAEAGAERRLDTIAASWVASGRVPERWRAEGRGLSDREIARLAEGDEADAVAAELIADGAGGWSLLGAMRGRLLHGPVEWYYRRGTIHALGWRPALVLAMTGRG